MFIFQHFKNKKPKCQSNVVMSGKSTPHARPHEEPQCFEYIHVRPVTESEMKVLLSETSQQFTPEQVENHVTEIITKYPLPSSSQVCEYLKTKDGMQFLGNYIRQRNRALYEAGINEADPRYVTLTKVWEMGGWTWD